jgi:hypothetical protein
MKPVCEPRRLGVGHVTELPGRAGFDDGLGALDGPDLEAGILRLEKDLVAVEGEECFRSILASCSAKVSHGRSVTSPDAHQSPSRRGR